jgi:hypothetical protein
MMQALDPQIWKDCEEGNRPVNPFDEALRRPMPPYWPTKRAERKAEL